MLDVIGCVAHDHDLRLVLLAAAICALACWTAQHMLTRGAAQSRRARAAWLVAAAIAFGTGTWTTHFIAILAFHSGLPIGFAGGLTTLSLLLPIGCSLAAFACVLAWPGAAGLLAGGLLLGGGIGAMHYTGMAALRLPGLVQYRPGFLAASVVLGVLCSGTALAAFRRDRRLVATALLWLGICGLHFTGMTAARIVPLDLGPMPDALPPGLLAITVGAAGLLVINLCLFASVLDKRLAARDAAEAARLRAFADATFEGILFERDGTIRDANAALGEMIGCPPAELVGRSLGALFTAETSARVAQATPSSGHSRIEGDLLRAGGGSRPVELLRRALGDPGGTMLAVRDLSARRAAEQRIKHLAHYDGLTGLANRLRFGDRLNRALATAERAGQGVALLLLDIDRFKAVNDLLGHPAGDRLLMQAAARLADAVREMDTAARLGGDEFAVVQPLADQPEAALALAERLLAALTRPYELDGQLVAAGASIGIALFPRDGATAEALTQSADLALYRAKQEGRGVFRCFEPEMDRQLQRRRAMEHDLRAAIAQGDLHLHYQPLFSSGALDLLGYEALLRWTHPRRGQVPPAEFIPVAEESGLIGTLGGWVLDRAVAEAASWSVPHRIAVNLSPVQFRQADLVGLVAGVLARYGLDPGRLELEITEGVLIDSADRALSVLNRLKALGVRIALDDFGTGYSSLSYLRRFPFDKIKIDRSFVQGLGEDADADAIVQSIVALSRSLRLEVTAEGVETDAQLQRLREVRCAQVQGFLLGEPRAAPRLAASAA